MTKKGLLLDLIALVDPSRVIITFPGLICAVATLLSKLVTTEDNVEVLRDSGLIGRLLSPLLTCNHSEVINSILNVLINLAFDIVSDK